MIYTEVALRLKFPPHFQDRMQERGIQIEHVRAAINQPDFTKETFQGRVLARKKIDERTIEVIYYRDPFRDSNDTTIITAVYLIL